MKNGGVDGIIVENFGDVPFVKNSISKLTLSHFTNIAKEIADSVNIDIGINVLRNDGEDDFDKYAVKPGNKLFEDLFLD